LKKTVIITGANRGLGKGFVDVLIQDEDCFIISISRRLSEEQKTYSSERFFFLEMDLSQDDISKKLSQLEEKIGNEAVFYINNASIIEPIVKIEDLDEKAIDKIDFIVLQLGKQIKSPKTVILKFVLQFIQIFETKNISKIISKLKSD
jgi:NAD(P)-dependent dehydrogenase (short-subunit alcohol dehydrogenase family)